MLLRYSLEAVQHGPFHSRILDRLVQLSQISDRYARPHDLLHQFCGFGWIQDSEGDDARLNRIGMNDQSHEQRIECIDALDLFESHILAKENSVSGSRA